MVYFNFLLHHIKQNNNQKFCDPINTESVFFRNSLKHIYCSSTFFNQKFSKDTEIMVTTVRFTPTFGQNVVSFLRMSKFLTKNEFKKTKITA